MTLSEQISEVTRRAKEASRIVAKLTPEEKNRSLVAMADAIERQGRQIQEANAEDMETANRLGLSPAMQDRLKLTEKRIAKMVRGLREVAELPDPVGRCLEERVRPNGLHLRKVATPIGVIVIIYESRPDVTADAASLCFKSGNATVLRGGKEALQSNLTIARTMVEAAREAVPAFPEHAIQVVPTTDRQAIPELLSRTQEVDLCIPRGGEGLIRAVAESSKVPVIKHYKGVCHVYIDREADPEMAESITLNAKTQRCSVCNAAETLLIDEAAAPKILARLTQKLLEAGVALRTDETTRRLLPEWADRLEAATEEDWTAEYNDLILAVRVVPDLDEAIRHINQYGSAHSDSIVTRNPERARRFLDEVDSAAVYWNASTRFTDGAEFGMGAEIGISTDKVGARGPMGLEELTSYKWIGTGTGQIRS